MPRLATFPVSYKVRGRKIIIIGGGLEALAKARLAVKTDAEVLVISAELLPEFDDIRVTSAMYPAKASDLDNVALIFIAEESENAERVKILARQRGIPVNVVDRPDECDFFTPAIVDRAPVSVAISSEGDSPVLARLIRARIEAALPPHAGRLAAMAGELRDKVFAALGRGIDRRHFFEALANSGKIERALEAGDEISARREAELLLDAQARDGATEGFVWLIGAGPGAEDLLTLRAQRLLQSADVIVHDALVPNAVVEMGRRDAERIAVGKAKGNHPVSQARINSTLILLAKEGKRVARLKGGDPMIFGRAGEEIAALRRAGVGYTIVPGVTAALAAAAETATPLTLRGVSTGVVFATAHGADDEELDHWAALAQAGITLGIYMGKSVAGRVSGKLIENGMDACLPIGIVVNAGRGGRRTYRGTLGELGGNHAAFVSGPALILIGKAVEAGDWESAAALAPLESELVA
ncbi:MAG: siroheme synthase CysG [Cucumibacter sp.]